MRDLTERLNDQLYGERSRALMLEASEEIKSLRSKLDAQEKAGKMLAEGVADSLKLLRAIQKDLWDRALIAQKPGADVVVSIGNSVWRRLCVAVGEPE